MRHQGEAALPALLTALMAPGVDKTLRDGAHRVLVDSSSARMRELSVPLVSRRALSSLGLYGADLAGVDFSGSDLGNANLGRSNLTGANLAGADLGNADLALADLTNANLHNANLFGANLRRARLNGANLSGAVLSEAVLSDADLTGADLGNAQFNQYTLPFVEHQPPNGMAMAIRARPKEGSSRPVFQRLAPVYTPQR